MAAAAMLVLGPAAAAEQQPIAYPPASLFRELQLTALACGRDNDNASCSKARLMADPLLDHPRLSASCKDTLWLIRQKAVSAASNTYERRDAIDRAARDVTVFCRQPAVPASSSGGTSGPGPGQSSPGGGSFFKPTP